MKPPRLLPVLAALALLVGCASTGGIHPTHTMRPVSGGGAGDWPDPAKSGAAWVLWHDAALDALLVRALTEHPTLQVTQLRVAQARAAAEAAGAARQPRVAGAVDLIDQRYSKNYLYPPPLAGSTEWNATGTISASWEWDLFGKTRATLASAVGQQRAAEAEAQAAGMLLAANIAGTWVSLGQAIEQRAVVSAALAEREQVLALVRQRVSSGLDNTVDLRQAEVVVAQTRVDLAGTDEQIGRLRHALAELTGQGPDALAAAAPTLAPLNSQPLPTTLPADLIGRRADVVAQRWRVEATLQDVEAARAQFYPNVNLTAFVGLSSLGLERFLESGSLGYGAGPALRLPIFDGTRLRAQLAGRSAEADIAVETYNATVLRALREVADEASSLKAIEAQQREQTQAGAAAESAFGLAVQRYRAGLGNFLVVLTAESEVLRQRRIATDLKARHLLAEVSLSRALGGGVTAEPPAARLSEGTTP